MSGFEPYARDAAAIEQEIAKRGLAIGVDWSDEVQVRALARELLNGGATHVQALVRDSDLCRRARGQLFALAILMQQTMAESAENGVHTHGGPVWKALGRALVQEGELSR